MMGVEYQTKKILAESNIENRELGIQLAWLSATEHG
jgi:hypothetical protein